MFSPQRLAPAVQELIVNSTSRQVIFLEVPWGYPSAAHAQKWSPEPDGQLQTRYCRATSIFIQTSRAVLCSCARYTADYLHMCVFFIYTIWRLPIIQEYEYVFRVDAGTVYWLWHVFLLLTCALRRSLPGGASPCRPYCDSAEAPSTSGGLGLVLRETRLPDGELLACVPVFHLHTVSGWPNENSALLL